MGILSIFKKNNALRDWKDRGALVVDVRTSGEFNSGHVKGSHNIPLDRIQREAPRLIKTKRPVVFCCASGMRSGQAARWLKQQGLECINGGSWRKVQRHFE